LITIVKTPGNGRLNNLNDPVLNVLRTVTILNSIASNSRIMSTVMECEGCGRNRLRTSSGWPTNQNGGTKENHAL